MKTVAQPSVISPVIVILALFAAAVVFFGWSIFGENLSTLQLAGCATIMASGCASTQPEPSKEPLNWATISRRTLPRMKAR